MAHRNSPCVDTSAVDSCATSCDCGGNRLCSPTGDVLPKSAANRPAALVTHNVPIEGLAATELGRSPESSKTTGRKECAYGLSLSNVGVGITHHWV